MAKNIDHVQHIKSKNVVEIDGVKSPKLPNPSALTEGEIAINYAKDYETISLKNESGDVVTFSSDKMFYTKDEIDASEKATSAALNDLNRRKLDASAYTPVTIDQVIDSTTSGSSGAVSTSAVYEFVTSYTPSITVDQVLDDTTSASTNPVSSKAVYDAVTDNELVWTNAYVTLSGTVSAHTADTSIHLVSGDREKLNSITGTFGSMAYENASSYSSATEVNTALGNKLDTTAYTPSVELWVSGTGENAIVQKDGGNTASGKLSVAMGSGTTASGDYSVAEGYKTVASGNSSHAEGQSTKANGSYSHAEGSFTKANGNNSHAEGSSSIASVGSSHAEGNSTNASGFASHAEGRETIAYGANSHAEGYKAQASGETSHAEGEYTIASGQSSHAEGYKAQASGKYSHAEGENTATSGQSSHAEGYKAQAIGKYSHAEGRETKASGTSSHAEGYFTFADGSNSHSEGYAAQAKGSQCHAEGNSTKANSDNSHAEGYGSIAEGYNSHAEGYYTQANGDRSHSEGYYTVADGNRSHAEGSYTSAMTYYSHAEGQYTITSNESEHASGQYNVSNSGSSEFGHSGNTLFSVGNGNYNTERHNAFEIRQNGDIYIVNKDGNDVKLQDEIGNITVDQVIDSGTSASTNAVATKAVFERIAEIEYVTATALNDLNRNKLDVSAYTPVTIDQVIDSTTSANTDAVSTNAVYEFVTAHTPSIAADQVIDSGTSASTNAVATKAVYEFVTAHTPSIAADQVIDSGTSASTNAVATKAVYDYLELNFYTKEDIDNGDETISSSLNDLNIRKLDASAYTQTDLNNYYTKSETSGASEIASAITEITNAIAEKSDSGHTHEASGITAMTGYQIGASSASVLTTDTLLEVIGKLEKRIALLETALGGMSLVKISSTDYDNLNPKDPNTLYIFTD